MLVHRRVTPSIKFAGIHLYTWVERGTMKVKCLAQEHNTTGWVWLHCRFYIFRLTKCRGKDAKSYLQAKKNNLLRRVNEFNCNYALDFNETQCERDNHCSSQQVIEFVHCHTIKTNVIKKNMQWITPRNCDIIDDK